MMIEMKMMTIPCDDDSGDHETLDGHSLDGLHGDLETLDGHSLGGLDSLGGLHGDG